ncbi:hypothetical protein D3C80_1680400 [compost metagenome]
MVDSSVWPTANVKSTACAVKDCPRIAAASAAKLSSFLMRNILFSNTAVGIFCRLDGQLLEICSSTLVHLDPTHFAFFLQVEFMHIGALIPEHR